MLSAEFRSILVFLVAFFAAVFVLPKLANIAEKIGLVDQPNQRKVHSTPRPLVGGIGMMISATFAALLLVPLPGLRGFFAGLATLLLIGFLDDFREIGHRQKFLAQILACSLLIYFSKTVLFSFGDLIGLGDLVLPYTWLAWLGTVFCVVGVINAINLIDGLDGLAGGICFVAFMMFAAHASFAGNGVYLFLNLAFAGAVLGFLRFNWHPSSLFMGDAGSLCLGFTLAFMAIAMSQGENAIIRPITALLILTVPIVDTLTIMSKRALRGKSPFEADRHHLHHIIMRFGLSREVAVKVIIGVSTILGCISLLGPIYKLPDYFLFGLFSIYFVGYIISSFFILDFIRYRLKFKRKRDWCGKPCRAIRIFFVSFDWMRIFRKSERYNVELLLHGYDKRHKQSFDGVVLNISKNGFMADIPEITMLGNKVELEIYLPPDISGQQCLKVSGEHIWLARYNSGYMHGFKFSFRSDEQRAILTAFLEQLKKNKSNFPVASGVS